MHSHPINQAGPSKAPRGDLQPYTNNSSSQWYTSEVALGKSTHFSKRNYNEVASGNSLNLRGRNGLG